VFLAVPCAELHAQDFAYTNTGGAITITHYTGPGGNVIIPSTINGLPVVAVGDSAFFYNTNVTSVAVPDSVTYIGNGALIGCFHVALLSLGNGITNIADAAFSGCSSLADVVIPDSVSSIGKWAFAGTGLTNATIGKGVTTIGANAFPWCYFTVSTLNSSFSSADGVLFNKDQSLLLQCPNSKAGSYTLPASVITIGPSAFYGCSGLTNVVIPDSVTSIGEQAFSSSGLSQVMAGKNVTRIGDNAFSGCSSLASLTLGNSVSEVGNFAFADCRGLTSLTLPDSLTSLGTNAFQACGLTNLTFGSGLAAIPENGFSGCNQLSSVAIPNSVTAISNQAFQDCWGLASVNLGSIKSIGDSAFDGCAFTNLVIPDSVITIGDSAFSSTTTLTNVSIGRGLTNIVGSPFAWCYNLQAIVASPLNPTLGSVDGVLFDKGGATLVAYADGKGVSYVIPTSVRELGLGSFRGASFLEHVTIPDTVVSIGDRAFEGCYSLANVEIPNSITNIGNSAFLLCYSLTNLTIGNGVRTIGDFAFGSCTHLATLTIPNGVTSLGINTFSGDSGLSGLYFLGNAPSLNSSLLLGLYEPMVYYLPGTAGWGTTFGRLPTAPWLLPAPVILSTGSTFGLGTYGLVFVVSWATNLSVVVEASTNLSQPVWQPLQTNALINGWFYFTDHHWSNYPARFYRVQSR
jgi:hypothetical protein